MLLASVMLPPCSGNYVNFMPPLFNISDMMSKEMVNSFH